eukprot:TRINITY_DN29350_c0_g1_i1.p1 TRINITY_DN29350_c0_g1~~TRINITY_DN29350_c0_g1_i1.p1  ORF type:complete len:287 (+),score=49.35 TRINITY_DN29350_c0_g1_i1:305-1165(+)
MEKNKEKWRRKGMDSKIDADVEEEEMEAVLERAWDLHDKISDAIHSISRSIFLSSRLHGAQISCLRQDEDFFVETRSLNAIRSALEVLENQLYLLHTLQNQQRVEKEAALMRLEESRLMLLKKLKEHRGRELSVIREAMAFASDKGEGENIRLNCNAVKTSFSNETSNSEQSNTNGDPNSVSLQRKCFNGLNCLFSLSIRKLNNTEQFLKMASVAAKVALMAASMLTILHIHHNVRKEANSVARHTDAYFQNSWYSKKQYGVSNSRRSRTHDTFGYTNLDVLHGRG